MGLWLCALRGSELRGVRPRGVQRDDVGLRVLRQRGAGALAGAALRGLRLRLGRPIVRGAQPLVPQRRDPPPQPKLGAPPGTRANPPLPHCAALHSTQALGGFAHPGGLLSRSLLHFLGWVWFCSLWFSFFVGDSQVTGEAAYANNMSCVWEIRGPEGSTVTLSFEEFVVEANYDVAYLYTNASRAQSTSIAALTGNLSHGMRFSSPTGTLVVVFTSDSSVTSKGFAARWTIAGLRVRVGFRFLFFLLPIRFACAVVAFLVPFVSRPSLTLRRLKFIPTERGGETDVSSFGKKHSLFVYVCCQLLGAWPPRLPLDMSGTALRGVAVPPT